MLTSCSSTLRYDSLEIDQLQHPTLDIHSNQCVLYGHDDFNHDYDDLADLRMTRAREMRVHTRSLPEADSTCCCVYCICIYLHIFAYIETYMQYVYICIY